MVSRRGLLHTYSKRAEVIEAKVDALLPVASLIRPYSLGKPFGDQPLGRRPLTSVLWVPALVNEFMLGDEDT